MLSATTAGFGVVSMIRVVCFGFWLTLNFCTGYMNTKVTNESLIYETTTLLCPLSGLTVFTHMTHEQSFKHRCYHRNWLFYRENSGHNKVLKCHFLKLSISPSKNTDEIVFLAFRLCGMG